nr:hypothetical protein [Marinobacter salarius]
MLKVEVNCLDSYLIVKMFDKPRMFEAPDDFWKRRGYRKVPALNTEYRWKDVGEETETAKPMTFWLKAL